MILRTTKQIIVDELNFDGDKGLSSVEFCKSVDECASLRVVWFRADELKKEILDYQELAMNGDEVICPCCNQRFPLSDATLKAVISDILGLCNSQEQKKKCTCNKSEVNFFKGMCGRCGGEL